MDLYFMIYLLYPTTLEVLAEATTQLIASSYDYYIETQSQENGTISMIVPYLKSANPALLHRAHISFSTEEKIDVFM